MLIPYQPSYMDLILEWGEKVTSGICRAEFREETAKYILNSGRSATNISEEIGIDKNTVCKWVREYRRKNGMEMQRE